jgi:hypothetical protein
MVSERAFDTVATNMGEAAAKAPYWTREEVRAKQRERYLSLTPEQREERRKRQTELQRLRRARLKKQAAVKGAAAGASRIAPDASKPVSAFNDTRKA